MNNGLREGDYFSLVVSAQGHKFWAHQTPEFDREYEFYCIMGEETPPYAVVRFLTDDGPFKAGQEIVCAVIESKEGPIHTCVAELIGFATADQVNDYVDACMAHADYQQYLLESGHDDSWGDEGVSEAEAAFHRHMSAQAKAFEDAMEREAEIQINRHLDGIHQINDEDLPKVYGGQP